MSNKNSQGFFSLAIVWVLRKLCQLVVAIHQGFDFSLVLLTLFSVVAVDGQCLLCGLAQNPLRLPPSSLLAFHLEVEPPNRPFVSHKSSLLTMRTLTFPRHGKVF